MKLRAINATRFLRLMPALLQIVWGPALCMAMLNTHARPRLGIAEPMRDPISAVYAGILNPIRPAATPTHEHSCSAALGIAAEPNDAALAYRHIFPLPWGAGTGLQNPVHGLAICPWSARRSLGLNSIFNALYTVNKSSAGIGSRRVPKLAPSYWGRLPLPSTEGAPQTGFTHRSLDLARLDVSFGKIPIADLVKANIFRLVSLASW